MEVYILNVSHVPIHIANIAIQLFLRIAIIYIHDIRQRSVSHS